MNICNYFVSITIYYATVPQVGSTVKCVTYSSWQKIACTTFKIRNLDLYPSSY